MPTFVRDGATISYTDTGQPLQRRGAQTVFFGHGLLFGGWIFKSQIEALRAEYRCVTIDWRGQGDSAAAKHGYDMDTLADDAVALVESLGIAPVHYVGLSMGGFIGQRIAARHPKLVRTLSLLNTSAVAEDSPTIRKYRLLAGIYRASGIRPLRKAVLPMMFGRAYLSESSSRTTIDEWVHRLRRTQRSAVAKAVMGVANRPAVLDEIGSINAPTLVIGGADDVAISPSESQRIAQAIPGARYVQLADCGHMSTLEQADAVTGLLRTFVAQNS